MADNVVSPLSKCKKIDITIDTAQSNKVCGELSLITHRCGDGFVDTKF